MLSTRLLLAFLFCATTAAAQPKMGPPAVGVVKAEPTSITESDEFVGRVEAISRVALVARVTAFLEKRLFTEGSEVKQGDMLYNLEEGPFQADFLAKQAALGQVGALLANANQTLGRQQRLLNTPAGQQSTLDSAIAQQRSQQAQVLAAQANLATAQINLDYTRIKAPIAGRISRTAVTEGNVVGPTSGTLATIVSQDPIYVVFPVSSRAVLDLRARYAGHGGFSAVRVRIRLSTGAVYDMDGKLDYVGPTISASTDTLTARAEFPNPERAAAGRGDANAPRELIDGEFVSVMLQGVTPIKVLGVPRAAVLSDQQGDYVFTVDAQNNAQETRVQLGQSTPATAAVVSGLTEGQTVIVEGIQRVRPGIAVIPGPVSISPPNPAPHAG